MQFVQPKTYLIGATALLHDGLLAYLEDTGNLDFLETVQSAQKSGLSDGEILCSYYAKLCYASLTLGKNANVSRVRDIPENLKSCVDSRHGSVFEHAWLNFVTTDCSRVFTHELVRHRVGTAFSQTSGRYVRTDEIKFVLPPDLAPHREALKALIELLEHDYHELEAKLGLTGENQIKDFNVKKKLTSALRRILPNGMANEIGWSVNLRSLRHTIEMRTSPAAEWEIRLVFNQVADLVSKRWPGILDGGTSQIEGGLVAYSGLRI